MKNLSGKVAVITGAASGLGRGLAAVLAAEGCRLALVDVHAERLAEVAAEHPGCSTHVVDVSDRAAMAALPEAVIAAHGAVHLVVNNAGVTITASFLDDLEWLLGINLWGVIHGCKFFLPELKKADEAHIVNISSMFGFIGMPSQSSYCATKFAVKGLTESLWTELQGTNVGVTSIHPGGIATNIHETMRSYDDEIRDATVQGLAQSRPPSSVAQAIIKAIEANKLRAIVGREAYLADWMKRLLPVRTHRMLAKRMGNFGGSR